MVNYSDTKVSPVQEYYIEAVRTTKHPSSKIGATHMKGPQNPRHLTCKVVRAPRSHDFYDVNLSIPPIDKNAESQHKESKNGVKTK